MQRKVIQVEEKVPFLQGLPLSFQHLFAMFGASVLVPFLLNDAAKTQVIDPSLVLLMNGIGTLLYIFLCKGRSPAFLGSSFAFIVPAQLIITSSSDAVGNYSNVLGGFIVSAFIFCIVALIVGVVGTEWLNVVLPPAAMGPIVALIGLDLAHTATEMAGLTPTDGVFDSKAIIVSLFTLAVVILGTLLFRGFFSIIPILFGVLSGYTLAAFLGMVDFTKITGESVKILSMPTFVLPTFDITAIMIIIPATLVVISEHIGHLFVTGNIVGRDLTKDPGLHRSLLGDGLSSMISGFAGSVPTTTYGENMGVMAITKVYSVWIIGGAGVISIILAFFGNLSGAISSIPVPVMGGICILLFGVIAASGIRMLVEAKVDYSNSKNLILTSVILIVGISQVAIKIGSVELKGMVLATVVGMLLSLMIYLFDKLKLTNDN
ncbi:MAG: uracil permease [Firmicutes bacterium HGW-Firmicutes-7]|nr:MAG: uracil permease [Firmicutes bacterium HGW-Firmicutes-7]